MGNIIPLVNDNQINNMEEHEDAVIKAAMEKYKVLDPRDDYERHRQLLLTEHDGVTYRRFIVDCRELTEDELCEQQVRLKVVDTIYCIQELGPLIEKQGQKYLPFVSTRTKSVYNIENGHHRIHYILHLREDETVAVFVVSSECHEMKTDGTYGEPVDSSYLRTIAGIRSNPPAQNKQYQWPDVSLQLADLFKLDPTFNGMNPSGKFPERPTQKDLPIIFKKVMDELHPNQFLIPQTRGRIFNAWDKQRDGTKIKNVSFADKTNALVTEGYDPGVTKTPRSGKNIRIKNFLEHYDEDSKAYIAFTDTNGKNFESKIVCAMIEAYHEGFLHGDKDHGVVLFCEIYRPAATMSGLNKSRISFETTVRKWNGILINTVGLPFGFTKIIFPKQLTSANDKRKVVEL